MCAHTGPWHHSAQRAFQVFEPSLGPEGLSLPDLRGSFRPFSWPFAKDELLDLGTNSGYAGVSSFGFGGTNARADIWGKAQVGQRRSVAQHTYIYDSRLKTCIKLMLYNGLKIIIVSEGSQLAAGKVKKLELNMLEPRPQS